MLIKAGFHIRKNTVDSARENISSMLEFFSIAIEQKSPELIFRM